MLIHTAENLAAYVRTLRKQLSLSQTQASELVGLQQKTLSDFERRPQGTKLDTLFRILAALDLEMHITPKQPTKELSNNQEW